MKGRTEERGVRRILVALDTSADSVAALEAAAELAARTEAELVGLYVEDVNLVRLLEHASSMEIDDFLPRRRRLTGPELERQLRAQIARMRRSLIRIAERRGVPWTFRTARGRVAGELADVLREADLVSLGVRGRSQRWGAGSTVRALLDEPGGRLLVLRRGVRLGRRVHVLHDGTPGAAEALRSALPFLRGGDMELTVLLRAPGRRREAAERELREWLREHELDARLVHLSPAELPLQELWALLRREGCGLFVVSRASLQGQEREFRRLLSRADCPTLIVH